MLEVVQEIVETLSDVKWPESFIREIVLISRTALAKTNEGTMGTVVSGLHDVRLVISVFWKTRSESNTVSRHGLDIRLFGVRTFSIGCMDELGFRLVERGDRFISLDLTGVNGVAAPTWFHAERIVVDWLLDDEMLCPTPISSHEFQEPTGKASLVDIGWRRCHHCENIWAAHDAEDVHRCPSCKELTKLVDS